MQCSIIQRAIAASRSFLFLSRFGMIHSSAAHDCIRMSKRP